MARFYHLAMELKEDRAVGGMIGGHITAGQNPDRADMIQRPKDFGGGEEPLIKGAVTLGLQGWGWRQIGPGEFVDLPEGLSTKVVKNAAPQLLTKAEAIKAGIANEDGSLRSPPQQAQEKQQPRKQ